MTKRTQIVLAIIHREYLSHLREGEPVMNEHWQRPKKHSPTRSNKLPQPKSTRSKHK